MKFLEKVFSSPSVASEFPTATAQSASRDQNNSQSYDQQKVIISAAMKQQQHKITKNKNIAQLGKVKNCKQQKISQNLTKGSIIRGSYFISNLNNPAGGC